MSLIFFLTFLIWEENIGIEKISNFPNFQIFKKFASRKNSKNLAMQCSTRPSKEKISETDMNISTDVLAYIPISRNPPIFLFIWSYNIAQTNCYQFSFVLILNGV